MRQRRVLAVLACCWLAWGTGCGGGSSAPPLVLDGSPRRHNAQGEVKEVTRQRLTLADGRSWKVPDDLACFSGSTLQAVPLLERKGSYVLLGVGGGKVRWIAAYGQVVRLPNQPPTVYIIGELVRVEGRDLVLRDGTVVQLAEGVAAPAVGQLIRADVDATTGSVRATTRV